MKSSATGQTRGSPKELKGTIFAIRLFALMLAGVCPTSQASESTTGAQWNIMVIPGNQTAFSGQARELFDKRCASCHSKDGRAQTPVARQRHVQDLSECKLTDNEIVRQILEGTHNKTNTFKMPPFKEKLTRAEVESLVPLVKAFRPVSTLQELAEDANPRLVGLINHSHIPFAVLEVAGSSNRCFILREKESHEGVTLLKIYPQTGTVKLTVGGTSPVASLTLDGQVGTPKGKGFSGFLDWLGVVEAPHKVMLDRANLDVVLFLYSQFTGRTLLRSPRLPTAVFDLDVLASSPEVAAQRLKTALAVKGIMTIEDGEQFLLVVPVSEVSSAEPRSSEIKPLTSDNDRPELFPGGAFINFPNTDVIQVAKFYTDLTGRTLDNSQTLPANGTVIFTTQTALSKDEIVYALETLLGWQGLKLTPAGGNACK